MAPVGEVTRVSECGFRHMGRDCQIDLDTRSEEIDTILGTNGRRGILACLVAPSPGDEIAQS